LKAGTRRLEETASIVAALLPIYPTRINTLDLLAEVLRGTDYDGNVRSGISDPTPAQAAQLEQHHLRQRNIRDNEVLLLHSAKMLYALIQGIPNDIDTKALVRQHQCRGGTGSVVEPEGWELPGLCERLYDTRDYLCTRCYQRRWNWSREHPRIEGAA
jgi:hypothetical protein